MTIAAKFSVLPLIALLAACSQSDAPSQVVEEAADDIVEAVAQELEAEPEAAPVQLGKYEPRNECSDMGGADAFLAVLGGAVEMRDTDVLFALAAEDIKLDFGGGGGAEQLRAQFDAEDGAMWEALTQVLALGCASNSQGGITMPWYFAQETQIDPLESLIVTGTDVPMRVAAIADAEVLAQVSWEEVAVVRTQQGGTVNGGNPEVQAESWTKVRLPAAADKEEVVGFIRNDRLRSVIDYRLIASSRNGRWRITALIAGD